MAGRADPELARRLERFVCVRLVQAWGLELDVFFSDPRLTFSCVFLNADGAVYGRFHARKDDGLQALAEALDGALELHRRWPANRAELEGKKAPPLPWEKSSDVPQLRRKFGPAGVGGLGCLHCHDVRDGLLASLEKERGPAPERLRAPWPSPERIGITLRTGERASVAGLRTGGPAERAGLREGDRLRRLGGQPLLSAADVEWALFVAPDEGEIAAEVEREGAVVALKIPLAKGWRNP